jgi:hypothetical protein
MSSEILDRLGLTPEKVAKLVANKPLCSPAARAYLAAIGARGGRQSKRTLSSEAASAMVAASERKRVRSVKLGRTGKHWLGSKGQSA